MFSPSHLSEHVWAVKQAPPPSKYTLNQHFIKDSQFFLYNLFIPMDLLIIQFILYHDTLPILMSLFIHIVDGGGPVVADGIVVLRQGSFVENSSASITSTRGSSCRPDVRLVICLFTSSVAVRFSLNSFRPLQCCVSCKQSTMKPAFFTPSFRIKSEERSSKSFAAI